MRGTGRPRCCESSRRPVAGDSGRHAAWRQFGSVGSVGSAGPTTTASGLLFVPSNDNYFHAFDSKTGKELWSTKLTGNMNANPMTFTGKSGKQYVAGVVNGSIVAFAVPASGAAKK